MSPSRQSRIKKKLTLYVIITYLIKEETDKMTKSLHLNVTGSWGQWNKKTSVRGL